MVELWDDRCVQIMPNTGIMVQDALVREVQSMKNDDMKRRARIAELESAIRRCCQNCWAAPAPDAAQCRLCGLKKALKGAGDE